MTMAEPTVVPAANPRASTRLRDALTVEINGQRVQCRSELQRIGAHVLVISTLVPQPDVSVAIQSVYVGHPIAGTEVVHLQTGPTRLDREAHPHAQLCSVTAPELCAEDHAERVLARLRELHHSANVFVTDETWFHLAGHSTDR
jgi:hypothetical protein